MDRDSAPLLTQRQENILAIIGRETSRNCISPTLREIGDECGISSSNGVYDHLRALMRKGYVEPGQRKMRGLALTELGWRYFEVFDLFGSMAKGSCDD